MTTLPLSALGRRIMIMGPSNAGKSTLAAALGHKLALPVHHIDTFRHLPNTDWQHRPTPEFHALHDAVVAEDEWILEGNYSEIVPQRIARATAILVIDDSLIRRYRRHFWRTLLQRRRAGELEGTKDSVKWMMIHWLWHTRQSVRKYRAMAEASGLPCQFVENERKLNGLYSEWSLERPC